MNLTYYFEMMQVIIYASLNAYITTEQIAKIINRCQLHTRNDW